MNISANIISRVPAVPFAGRFSTVQIRHIFILLLISRSALDVFTDVSFGPLKFNIPSLIGLSIIAVSMFCFLVSGKIKLPGIAIPFALWLLADLAFAMLSYRNFGSEGLLGFREWIRLSSIFLTFTLAYNVVSDAKDKVFLRILFWALPIPLLAAFYQIITHSGQVNTNLEIQRAHGSFVHPNGFSLFIVLFIGLTWFMYNSSKRKRWLILLALESVALMFTFSFGGFIMLGIVSFFLFFKLKPRQKIIIFIATVVFFAVLVQTSEFQQRWERIALIDLNETINQEEVVDSFTWRVVHWFNCFELWKERPIWGYGLNSSGIISPWRTVNDAGYAVHNDHLKFLLETGIIGFLIYITFIFYTGIYLYKEHKRCTNSELKYLLYVILSLFLAWQIGAIAGNHITATTFQFYFWAVMGVSLKLNSAQADKKKRRDESKGNHNYLSDRPIRS